MSPHRQSRLDRIELYADWLEHDADGLSFNLTHPTDQPLNHASVVLAGAREKLALALSRIDRAIEADKTAHAQQEHA